MSDIFSLNSIQLYIPEKLDNILLLYLQQLLGGIFTILWKDVKNSSDILKNFHQYVLFDDNNILYIELKKFLPIIDTTDTFNKYLILEFSLVVRELTKNVYNLPIPASTSRFIGDLRLFESNNPYDWEKMYHDIYDTKYKKGSRNFSRTITGKKWDKGEPPIYLIPRERGGESYKTNKLEGCNAEDIQYCAISKGYGMQDVSSFTLGPVVGEGLCIVNAAFSKSICIMHLEGGNVDLKRKNFWKPKKERIIKLVSENDMLVDNKKYNIIEWMKNNENLWLNEWEKWRKTIALCSTGDFHWTRINNEEYSPTLTYRYKGQYIDFVRWKIECYIKPAYELIPKTTVYEFLMKCWKEHKVPLGLVHPMARSNEVEKPITREFLINLIYDKEEMGCMPYILTAKLMDIRVE